MERDICDDYTALAEAVDDVIAYIDSTDETNGGYGFIDTGEVLWKIERLRQIRRVHEGG